MSTPIKDGGPAFPAYINSPSGLVFDALQSGMTLRDYFAGQALAGWLAGPCDGDTLEDYDDNPTAFKKHQALVAESVYGYADAMLAAREGKQ